MLNAAVANAAMLAMLAFPLFTASCQSIPDSPHPNFAPLFSAITRSNKPVRRTRVGRFDPISKLISLAINILNEISSLSIGVSVVHKIMTCTFLNIILTQPTEFVSLNR
ncbi:hypothetical protein BJ742DRAFT_820365 [Cladochytrium replicatum]|nr:hypothetical protein BJ742DRAFT_820365 [Cladochytrium replicatum]